MRFKTSALKEAKHTELVSCVAWMSPDDVISIGDDHKILKWNLVNSETKDLTELPQDFHPTDIHWYPRGGGPTTGGGGKKAASQSNVNTGSQDTFLVTSAEGKFKDTSTYLCIYTLSH